jgi:hypothetical protein
MSTYSQWLILFRVHLRMLRVKTAVAARRSRLMSATIACFLIGYMVAAYWLFSEGLRYVASLPAAGALLSDRLIYVMFFCFMMMLIFSVAVTIPRILRSSLAIMNASSNCSISISWVIAYFWAALF